MPSLPWFGIPRMSPAKASSASLAVLREEEDGVVHGERRAAPTWSSFIPRRKCPEQRRRKATRSRCSWSMLACTLKTKPVTFSSLGWTVRLATPAGEGGGASVEEAVQELSHAEARERAAEEDGGEVAGAVRREVELGAQAARHLHFLAELLHGVRREEAIESLGSSRPSQGSL